MYSGLLVLHGIDNHILMRMDLALSVIFSHLEICKCQIRLLFLEKESSV